MKAERRHELQHNPTADWLAAVIERVKPYSRAMVGVAVAGAVLLITYVVLSGRTERKQSQAWTDYYQAIQAESIDEIATDLETVAREHSGIAAGLWAEVALADLKLGEGIESLFRDKQAAQTKLKSAVGHYQTVLDGAEDPLLVARARFGIGRALESLGRLDEARDIFKEVVDASGTNAYVSLAEARLKDLQRGSTQDFYAWFAEQEPASFPPIDSLPGTPGEKLPFDPSSFGPPDGLNLSGEKILDIPPLGKQTTGPFLPPAAESNEKDSGEQKDRGKSEAAKDGSKGDVKDAESEDDKKEEATDEEQPAKEESNDAAKETVGNGETAKEGAASETKADDGGAKVNESSDDTKTPQDGA